MSIDKIKRKIKVYNKPDISVNDYIINLLEMYHGKYNFIIEYGYNQRLSVNQNVVLGIQGEYLEYYSLKEDNISPETIPLGAIHIPSITAIKRREGS